MSDAGVLAGLRILEIGHFVAAPFATRLLGDLGADVIKIEPPGGDPVRQWGEQIDGNSLWWSVHGRNKRSVVIDLKRPRGRELVLHLVRCCDALIENLRPGQLAKLGLAPERLRQENPGLIIGHVSGFGQSGPYRDRAAFGVVGEAIGGLRYLTDHPPGTTPLPPVRVGVSIGDSLAGLYVALGVLAALWCRDRPKGDGQGRTLDVALTESVLSLMEGMLPEYGALQKIKQPSGGGIPTAAPTNAYPTSDEKFVLIAANSEPLFAKLMSLIGAPHLSQAPCYAGNQARVANAAALDRTIAEWTGQQTADALIARLMNADIPCSRVYTAADIARDPHFKERGMVRQVADPLFENSVLQPGIVPHVAGGPSTIRWAGPSIGQHSDEVLGELLGLEKEELVQLRREGVIG